MKIATMTIYDNVMERAAKTSQAVNEAVNAVTHGRKITRLSDDPFRLGQMLETRADISGIDQYKRNIEMGQVWLTTSEIGLRGVQDRLSDIRTTAIKLANDNHNEQDRKTGANEIEDKILDIIEVANSDVNGRYIFGGISTDKPPFRLVDEYGEEVEVKQAKRVEYMGDKVPFQIKTNKSQKLAVGNDGSAIFSDMFVSLLELRDALKNNSVEGIQEQIDPVYEHTEHISAFNSGVGLKMNRLDFRDDILADLKLSNQDKLSSLAEVDMTEAATTLRVKEVAYQAALMASQRVLNMKGLMDYI